MTSPQKYPEHKPTDRIARARTKAHCDHCDRLDKIIVRLAPTGCKACMERAWSWSPHLLLYLLAEAHATNHALVQHGAAIADLSEMTHQTLPVTIENTHKRLDHHTNALDRHLPPGWLESHTRGEEALAQIVGDLRATVAQIFARTQALEEIVREVPLNP